MKYNITKEMLEEYLSEGKTNREIADIVGCVKSNIGHFITQFGLTEMQRKHKLPNYRFGKIDTKEKAYVLGAICCDGAIGVGDIVEMSVEKNDKEFGGVPLAKKFGITKHSLYRIIKNQRRKMQ